MGDGAASAKADGLRRRTSTTAGVLAALCAALASTLLIAPSAANADYLAIEICDPAPDCERIGQVDLPRGTANNLTAGALMPGAFACGAVLGSKAGPVLGTRAEVDGDVNGDPAPGASEDAWLALCAEPDEFGDPVLGAYRYEREVVAAKFGDLHVSHTQGSNLAFVYTSSWADTQVGDKTLSLRLVPRHWSEPSPLPLSASD